MEDLRGEQRARDRAAGCLQVQGSGVGASQGHVFCSVHSVHTISVTYANIHGTATGATSQPIQQVVLFGDIFFLCNQPFISHFSKLFDNLQDFHAGPIAIFGTKLLVFIHPRM